MNDLSSLQKSKFTEGSYQDLDGEEWDGEEEEEVFALQEGVSHGGDDIGLRPKDSPQFA